MKRVSQQEAEQHQFVNIRSRNVNKIRNSQRQQFFQNQRKQHPEFQNPQFYSESFNIDMLQQLVNELNSNDVVQMHHGSIGILIISRSDIHIDQIVDSGIVDTLINFLGQTKMKTLQSIAAEILTNITLSEDQSKLLLQKNLLSIIKNVINDEDLLFVSYLFTIIGNIASLSWIIRNKLIDQGFIGIICQLLVKHDDGQFINYGSFALSNLCRPKPLPKFQDVKQAVELLCFYLSEGIISDLETTYDAIWSVTFHTFEKNDLEFIFESNLLERLIPMLKSVDRRNLSIIRLIGNLLLRDEKITKKVFDIGFINNLKYSFQAGGKPMETETCWLISNIAAGSNRQILELMENEELLEILINTLRFSKNINARRQCCVIFSNLAHLHPQKEVICEYLVKIDLMGTYYEILNDQNNKEILLKIVLQCLYKVFKLGQFTKNKDYNVFINQFIKEHQGIPLLENLQHHQSEGVYYHTSVILEKFFEMEDPFLPSQGAI